MHGLFADICEVTDFSELESIGLNYHASVSMTD